MLLFSVLSFHQELGVFFFLTEKMENVAIDPAARETNKKSLNFKAVGRKPSEVILVKHISYY